MKTEHKEICKNAVRMWGAIQQRRMLVEECAELIVALHHQDRHKCTSRDVISEIADVTILLEQMKSVYRPELIEAAIEEKINRLENILGEIHEDANNEVNGQADW